VRRGRKAAGLERKTAELPEDGSSGSPAFLFMMLHPDKIFLAGDDEVEKR